jgi:DNA (cytosine-5)-methyltransferase 1
MWPLAGEVYKDNFPEAKFFCGKLEQSDPSSVARHLGDIDLLLASPECRGHSPARGSRAVPGVSVRTAYQVLRYSKVLRPRWIVVENVLSMKSWTKYGFFIDELRRLGYFVREQALCASHFGVPQSRTRLFITCDLEAEPREIGLSRRARQATARSVIDQDGEYAFSPLRKPGRAANTLARASRAVKALGRWEPFVIVYYGTDGTGGWQTLDVPLRTITTLDRFAFVRPTENGYEMRMLQVPELKKAMGFPPAFSLRHGTRRERIHLLGNAVCPPVMKSIVRALTEG